MERWCGPAGIPEQRGRRLGDMYDRAGLCGPHRPAAIQAPLTGQSPAVRGGDGPRGPLTLPNKTLLRSPRLRLPLTTRLVPLVRATSTISLPGDPSRMTSCAVTPTSRRTARAGVSASSPAAWSWSPTMSPIPTTMTRDWGACTTVSRMISGPHWSATSAVRAAPVPAPGAGHW
jgi:hypothetical protein